MNTLNCGCDTEALAELEKKSKKTLYLLYSPWKVRYWRWLGWKRRVKNCLGRKTRKWPRFGYRHENRRFVYWLHGISVSTLSLYELRPPVSRLQRQKRMRLYWWQRFMYAWYRLLLGGWIFALTGRELWKYKEKCISTPVPA